MEIKQTLRKNPLSKKLAFSPVKNFSLGKDYHLSLVLCGNNLSKKLNQKFRGKNKATNILTFPLAKNSGEIFINLNQAEREAKKNQESLESYTLFLFIHGLAHLKGLEHSARMDRYEKKVWKKFQL